jgi:hypothetical protein
MFRQSLFGKKEEPQELPNKKNNPKKFMIVSVVKSKV